ncbi:putative MarR family transcriptional regulator [Gordonia effusa NBRC 100432]|uniref:Putative MarR family transcriptional regulator n=1 Tax=Gordonia effusa NBRC 100432 TaxID=1077974 RepID=H0R3K5_9ACTN|nr:MarR family winged helix-turn-helix transcriptional regulator [Gordonia effusa]GAB19656.1 putative MarR family transcriptional regulator [Gordonia effusa NBRC 100432]
MSERAQLETSLSSAIRALTAESEQIGRIFARQHSLGANDFQALLRIMVADSAGEPTTAGRLAASLGLTSAAMTYLVDRMVASGHIRREPDPHDRRRLTLHYDARGMELAREFFGPLGELTHETLSGFSDEDLATTGNVLDALIEAMVRYSAEFEG